MVTVGRHLSMEEEYDLELSLQPQLAVLPAVAHHEAGHAALSFRTGSALGRLLFVQLGVYPPEWAGAAQVRPSVERYDWVAERHMAGDVAGYRFIGQVRPFPEYRPFEPVGGGAGIPDAAKAWQTAEQYLVEASAHRTGTFGSWIYQRAPRSYQEFRLRRWLQERYRVVLREIWDDSTTWGAIEALAKQIQATPPTRRRTLTFGQVSLTNVLAIELSGKDIVGALTAAGLRPREGAPTPTELP